MKKLFIYKIVLFLNLFAYLTYGQEGGSSGNCGDGIDNDGDGFVDCYDKECNSESVCDGFYLNNNATCEVKPTSFPNFTIKQLWASPKTSASNHSLINVGDILNADDFPEIFVTNSGENTLTLLNGTNGNIIRSIKSPVNLSWQDFTAIGNLGDPTCGWMFVATGNQIMAFDCNFNLKWQTGSGGIPNAYWDTGAIGLADFNQDGEVELYYKNEIRDAKTGKILVKGSGDWKSQINAGPVAVDITDSSPGLELVCGLTIYAVDIASGTLSVFKERPDYFVKLSFGGNQNHNFTSVADYNLDGFLDIIANGASGSPKGPSAVFYWDVKADVVKTFLAPNDWEHGTGRVNIANIDDVPGLNCTFATGTKIYALDENFDLKWEVDITEKTSGNTGTTVFDFNGDGKSEIVYRDEKFLYIIQDTVDIGGNPMGMIRQAFPCLSRTGREYPVVADVNGDGQTEICVACQHPSETQYNPRKNGHIRAFASDGEKWVPARKIWNQHAYFNVNINDDLTIPREQQKHHISFSDYLCELDAGGNPVPGKVRPLNSFLNQSPYLDNSGCPSYASPDVAFDDSQILIDTPRCPESEFKVSFVVKNDGDIPISNILNITF